MSRVKNLLEKMKTVEAEKGDKEVTGHDLVEYLKNEQWSDSKDHLEEAIDKLEKMCEMYDDEEVHSFVEFLDEKSSEFDLEEAKKRKKK